MYNINSIYGSKNNLNFKSRGNIMNDAPDYIKTIVKKLESAQSRKEMYTILDDAVQKTSEFICSDDTCFVGSGYKFQCTLKQYTDKYDIPKINSESGMKILKIIPIGKSDRSVVVSKVGD